MDYVSPVDERVAEAQPLAPRPREIAGRRIVLLDIGKERSAEFLDRLELGLHARGAQPVRLAKPLFSRPAPDETIAQAAIHGDLAVEALAD